ncbi:MAG: LLM class flavin-dependent oxidoreductase [Actinomycetota bacterium]
MSGTVEVSWFGALCDDDYEQLGVVRDDLLSSWDHCGRLVRRVDELGFDNVLLPSGYALGIDTVAFAAAIAPQVQNCRLLVAVRAGETWVPQLARQLATLDSILGGRLTVNIISSEMPGETLDGPARYRRTKETMDALRTLLGGRRLDISGEFMDLHLDPPRITRAGTCPPFYFGGLSDEARDAAAHGADIYLMWPDTQDELRRTMDDVQARAAGRGRTVRFGYRVHVVVRDTTQEAREAAGHLISAVDEETGNAIRSRSLDSQSTGVRRQAELRGAAAGDGFVEPALWTGIGRARSGCGAAVVGSPAEVLDKLMSYRDLGMEAFILSGYPHIDEAERFAGLVLPHIPHGPLA